MDRFNIRRLEGYTIMSNHHLRDQNLSHSARGLLSFMLSLPENWDYSFNGLVAISKEGKSAVRTMINELKQAKYIKITQFRDEKGYFQSKYDVYEFPYDMPPKMLNYPTPENRTSDYPISENQPQINTKEINTNKEIDKQDLIDKTKNDLNNFKHSVLIKELIRTGYIKEDDEQLILYDSLFDKYINSGNTYTDIYSAIHYIVPRVMSRSFIDEEGKDISNKFGYFKTSIESNFRKLNSCNEELYPEDDNSSFWDDYKFIDREGR